MTVQEAIKNVTAYVYMECENMPQQVIKALDVLKDSAKECEQYRALGTVEELKEAREKQIPKKPIEYEDKYYACPRCEGYLMYKWDEYPTKLKSKKYGLPYCLGCGQKLDWSEEDD